MENMSGNGNRRPGKQPMNPRPPPAFPPPRCPRCESINTKFCYYNNYSANQPRYLCKTCRRYWTHGGSLRNVPFGGGTRKGSKKSKIVSGVAASSSSGGEILSSLGDQRAPMVALQLPFSLQGNTGSLVNLASSFMSKTKLLASLAASMPSRPQIYSYNNLIFTGVGARFTNPFVGNFAQLNGGVNGSGAQFTNQSFGRNQNYQRQPPVNANLLTYHQPPQRQQSETERGYQPPGPDQRMAMVRQLLNIQPNPNNSNAGSNNGGTNLSWAQARMAVQQQNREPAGTSGAEPPISMVIQNQWSDDDDDEVHGYGPPSPSSQM